MDNSDISLLFYHYLCDVIGTEDVVNTRRQIYNAFEHVQCDEELLLLCSGSKAEGLEIKGSDLDIMMLQRYVRVYENSVDMMLQREELDSVGNGLIPRSFRLCPLLMDTSECKPGYTKLKIPTCHQSCGLTDLCYYKAGDWYISSVKCRECQLPDNPQFIIHGPCTSTLDGELDLVSCFRCKDWIRQAQSWLLRSHKNLTNCNILETIVDFGVLFVPIGCKDSPDSDLEWRISFSYAEKLLIWSFNHIQFICYALMKILLKEITSHYTGDLLCSYFLKTIMFWVCEETESNQWEAINILSCFMSCLDRLLYCVQYKTCVHYFIPENDLFENRFNRQQHTQLLSILKELRGLEWTCLLQTQTLQSFKSFLEPSFSSVVYCNSYLLSLITLRRVSEPSIVVLPRVIKLAVYHCMRIKNNFYIYMISIFCKIFSDTLSKEEIIYDDNKHKYILYRKRLYHLLIGLNQDAVSGWSRLASFFYVSKQYHLCIKIIADCLLKCTPDKVVLLDQLSNQELTRFELFRRSIRINHYRFINKYCICPLWFLSRSDIFPKEISVYEMTEKGTEMHLSPILFGLFLKFLCNHHLRKVQEKGECVHALKNVIKYGYYIFCGHDKYVGDLFLSMMNSLKTD